MMKIQLSIIALLLTVNVNAQQLSDPTRPSNAVEFSGDSESNSSEGGMQVQAIIIKGNDKYAVIQGVTVREGDVWQNQKVAKIHNNGVVFSSGNERLEVLIHNSTIKKDSAYDN